jgi:electron-transferring-flavoprotein dehydrogenase
MPSMSEREIMQYDVIIVGAGPAGLACAIRLKQISPDVTVAVIEKAARWVRTSSRAQ